MLHDFTDNELMFQWKHGNQKAFDFFYERHVQALLTQAAKKTKSWEAAEEIVQDVFVKLYLHSKDIEDNPLFYVKTILRNKVIDHYRVKLRQPDPQPMEENIIFENNPYSEIHYKELDSQIIFYITSLPEQCKKIFTMSRQDGLSNKEIANTLGISIKAVEAQITKALRYLRNKVDYNFILAIVISYWLN